MQTVAAKRVVRADGPPIPAQGRHPTAGRAGSYAFSGGAIALSMMALVVSSGDRLLHPLTPKVNTSRIPGSGHLSAIGPQAPPVPDPVASASDLLRMRGVLEALPHNIYHATPYNDWPLFRIEVREGQRLRFRREGGNWVGDATALFVQFETPAEIDGKKEAVEIAALEKQSEELARDVLRIELRAELAAATIREENARQQFARLERLRDRTSTTQVDFERGQNLLNLARAERAQGEALLHRKLRLAEMKVERAEHRLRQAQSELLLADFKRGMSWANVPVARGQFEEVVVTKIAAARGDVPNATGRKDVWIEVVDDRTLQVRTFLTVNQAGRIEVGRDAVVRQGDRTYAGRVDAIGAVADEETHLIPALVRVENTDRKLRIHTEVTVDFLASPPSAL